MQTKDQCLEKFIEMADQVRNHLVYKAESLLKSGAIDLEQCEDDFRLPKILLTACLEWEAGNWRPRDKKDLKTIKALSYF